ncbi:MAG: CopD family protein [Steroidobacteraceae bacterium]
MTDLLWVVARGVGFALPLQAAGAALFAALFAPLLPRSRSSIERLARRAAGVGLIAVAGQYLLEPARLAGELSGVLDASLHRLVLSSSIGAALGARFAGLACLALGGQPASALSRGVTLAGIALVAGSFVLTGHTLAAPYGRLLAPLLIAHVLILAFWFGALWPLHRVTRLESLPQAAQVLAAFSARAVWLVPVIAVAGIALAAALLPDFAALRQPYGLLLLGKGVLFALLMGLAALNKLRLAPGMGRGEQACVRRLRGSLLAEYLLICAALAVTAVMTGFFSPS